MFWTPLEENLSNQKHTKNKTQSIDKSIDCVIITLLLIICVYHLKIYGGKAEIQTQQEVIPLKRTRNMAQQKNSLYTAYL